jgi:hypothetical protein
VGDTSLEVVGAILMLLGFGGKAARNDELFTDKVAHRTEVGTCSIR